jgi:hypothetical protein
MKYMALIGAALLTGCVTVQTPGLVRVTHHADDIRGCVNLGEIDSFSFNPLAISAQRSQVSARGGDTLYTPSDARIVTMRNIAYRCSP